MEKSKHIGKLVTLNCFKGIKMPDGKEMSDIPGWVIRWELENDFIVGLGDQMAFAIPKDMAVIQEGDAPVEAMVPEQMIIPRPERDIFEKGVINQTENLTVGSPQPLLEIERIEYPEEGGIFVYYKDVPFPAKGFPFPEAVYANNTIKRILINWLRFLAKHPISALPLLRMKNLNHWVAEFNSMAAVIMSPYYLKEIRYSAPCREMNKVLGIFFKRLGIEGFADFAKAIVTMFEYDNAYLLMLQDLADETTKEQLLESPAEELDRLYRIFKSRTQNKKLHRSFGSVVKLLKLAFFIPRISKAFGDAVSAMDIKNIQMTDADRYYVLRWDTYDFHGEPFEKRIARYMEIHKDKMPEHLILENRG